MSPAAIAAYRARRAAALALGLCLCGEELAPERKACPGCLSDTSARKATWKTTQVESPPEQPRVDRRSVYYAALRPADEGGRG